MTQRNVDQQLAGQAGQAQQQAANPAVSVWVSAHAGTGKTTVLVNRLLQLMIAEPAAAPEEILGLTFSKAGAAQMLAKLTAKLAEFAQKPAVEITSDLAKLLGRPATQAELTRAQTLYNHVLDRPPQLLTIHAFCTQILTAFPLEAGIPPVFTQLEGPAAEELVRQALEQTLQAAAAPEHPLADVYGHVMAYLAERSLRSVVKGLLADRAKVQRLLQQYDGMEEYTRALAEALDVAPELAKRPLVENKGAYVPNARTQTLLAGAVPVLQQGPATMQTLAASLQGFLALEPDRQLRKVADYTQLFFTKTGSPKKNVITVKLAEQNPDLVSLFADEQARLIALKQQWAAQQSFCHTVALLRLTEAVLERYATLKRRQGMLDFEDLIQHTRALLHNPALGDWVRYKLDRRLKHVMLDEGQDTNQRQWEIMQALVAEFFAGETHHETPRTLFAVGDIKQSIYRFQEAEPRVFLDVWSHMQQWHSPQALMQQVRLATSFRTNPAILAAVDQVFSEADKVASLTGGMVQGAGALQHISAYPTCYGRVELWPVMKTEKTKGEATPWQLPAYAPTAESANWQVAERVARTAANLVAQGEMLSTGQAITYGHMMVLLRNWQTLPVLLERLHAWGVPAVVAGTMPADENPVVEDILALCRVLVNPADDLRLAQVLAGPFFNLTQAELANVAIGREEATLWHAVAQTLPEVAQQLLTWRQAAAENTIYNVLVTALHQRRGAFVRRFGGKGGSIAAAQAVQNVVDAVLDAALAHGYNWHGFIHQVEQNGVAVSSIAAEKGDAVRIMTAHGAKGLEAEVVFMPDTLRPYDRRHVEDKWLWQGEEWLLYSMPKDQATPLQEELLEAEKTRMKQDEERLLYVALTRAEERLYIGGALPANRTNLPGNCWYADVAAIATPANGWLEQEDGSRVLENGQRQAAQQSPATNTLSAQPPLPNWAQKTVVMPSRPPATPTEMVSGEEGQQVRQRGELLHKALEWLPAYPQENWPALAAQLTQEQPARLAAWVQQVVTAQPALFGPNSKAEVAVQGAFGLKRLDRVIITDQTVQVVDFKTVSHLPAQMPDKYRRQVQQYAAALAEIYPAKTVQAAILWLTVDGQAQRLDSVDLKP